MIPEQELKDKAALLYDSIRIRYEHVAELVDATLDILSADIRSLIESEISGAAKERFWSGRIADVEESLKHLFQIAAELMCERYLSEYCEINQLKQETITDAFDNQLECVSPIVYSVSERFNAFLKQAIDAYSEEIKRVHNSRQESALAATTAIGVSSITALSKTLYSRVKTAFYNLLLQAANLVAQFCNGCCVSHEQIVDLAGGYTNGAIKAVLDDLFHVKAPAIVSASSFWTYEDNKLIGSTPPSVYASKEVVMPYVMPKKI